MATPPLPAASRMSLPLTVWRMAEELLFKGKAASEYDRAFAHVTKYFMPFLLRAADVRPGMLVLDIATGTQKWVKLLDGGIWGTSAVDGEKLFIGTVLGKVGKFYAVNVSDGQIIWSKDEEGSIIAGAVIVDEQVIYATEAGRIQSVDKNGAPKWQSSIENAHFYTMPLLVGDTLLMAPMNANFLLAGYDVNNGSQKWTFSGK